MSKSSVAHQFTSVTFSQASRMLASAIRAGIAPILKGSPGLGKSAAAIALAKKFNLKLIDIRLTQCDPTDLGGFPTVTPEGRADYIPMKHFPLRGDPLPKDENGKEMNGWLIFLDEATSAPPAIQSASYKLILDHMVGSYHLHPKCAMVLAGNLESDGAIVHTMSTALQSRLMHLQLELNVNEWLEWAMDPEQGNIDHKVTDYIKFKPGQLYTFKADHTDNTYACPRTWEFTSKVMPFTEDQDRRAVFGGLLSEGVAREFILFTEIYENLVSMETIIASPLTASVPKEPSILFALTGSLAHNITDENAAAVLKYLKRIPAEFQVVCLRECVRRNKAILKNAAVREWITTSGDAFFG